MGHQLLQLRCAQACGRAAADIKGADTQPTAVGRFADGGQLLAELIHIGLHQCAGRLVPHRAGHKAAIAAPRRAERDARIDAAVHRVSGVQHRLLQVGNTQRQRKFFRRAGKMAKEALPDFRLRCPGSSHVVNDAHRAHAGHHAPRRCDAGGLAQKAVQQAAQRILCIGARRAQLSAPL